LSPSRPGIAEDHGRTRRSHIAASDAEASPAIAAATHPGRWKEVRMG
jgi:hypothetical protein